MDIEGGVESHSEVTLGILCEEAEEGLLEDRGSERVGDDDRAVGAVREGLHLKEADLVEAACKEVYGVAACGGAFSQGFKVLYGKVSKDGSSEGNDEP